MSFHTFRCFPVQADEKTLCETVFCFCGITDLFWSQMAGCCQPRYVQSVVLVTFIFKKQCSMVPLSIMHRNRYGTEYGTIKSREH
jgi:hypothetical protein